LAQIYEGMFVLDNDVVRAGWSSAKALVTDLIAKHGGTVTTARHWGERNLAYPINRKSRATYLLSFYELPNAGILPFVRDLDLSVPVMRYLLTAVDMVPEGEQAEADKEVAADFAPADPPRDDVGVYRLWEEKEEDRPRGPRRERSSESFEGEAEASAEGASETKVPVAAAIEGADSKEEN
jgi:ribosomal protein S6